MAADFTLVKASDGLKPKSEQLTLKIGQFTLNIPAGSFQTAKFGRFSFQGEIGEFHVKVILSPKGYKRYGIEATVSGVDLRNVCWKKTAVELKIGNDSSKTCTKPRC